MIKTTVLFSGSEGNCTHITDGTTQILIDAGGNEKKIQSSLINIGSSINQISAILITHEHTDHTKSLYTVFKNHTIPIYTSVNTARAICSKSNLNVILLKNIASCVNTVEKKFTYEINSLLFTPFATPHDVESHGFKIESQITNKTVSYATDTGCVTREMLEYFYGANIAVIESNHDRDMLVSGPYPEFLKQRILSNEGHLSNETASRFALWLAQNGTEKIILAHLSRENNTPMIAENSARDKLNLNGFNAVELKTATYTNITEEKV